MFQNEAKEMIREADKNGDGKVDYSGKITRRTVESVNSLRYLQVISSIFIKISA